MIRVEVKPQPSTFDANVTRPGRKILTKHKPAAPVPSNFWKGKTHWRAALRDLHVSYNQTCAFAAMRIEWVTGSPTVEHFKPTSLYPERAYSWENFRLVCGRLNGRKGNAEDVIDPFELPDNTFDVNPASGEILVHRSCLAKFRGRAQSTIERLKLNDNEMCATRVEHIRKIFGQEWSTIEAQCQSPFVYRCLKAQGLV